MADAAIAYSRQGLEVYFIAVSPRSEFFSARGRETLLQLIKKEPNTVHIISERVGYEFEFGTPEYRAWIYKNMIIRLPPGTPIVLSDDHSVWEAATWLQNVYPIIGVMHADEEHYYALAEKYSKKTDVFACVSNRVRENTRKRIPAFDAARIFTIPCGIHLPELKRVPPVDGTLRLIFVGRIAAYQKRAGDLVKIAKALTAKGIKYHLEIIGDGDLRQSLQDDVRAEGLNEVVTFPGWLSQQEVATHLATSDILLLTSDFEGTPIAMMEAFAAGCGMVGTRVSGIEDYEHHALAASCLGVYEVGDIPGAVACIEKIAAIPAAARSEAARALAEQEFSMDVCLKKYSEAMSMMQPRAGSVPTIELSSGKVLYSKSISLARYLKMTLTRRG
jgi:glycosyltransferase involved in cell wall biosynthesis